MGISGLLPALKSISTQKHLSEFAGQTIAVDAYVWLHRGVFTCPTELATGKDTHKYVDYAMHRVRLLRHHRIEPYIVFDGGPLPAKKGTEVDRHAKRAEHLALGNALAAQGKTSQAREHYVKSIDVTPQMAFQFIKALRAESVSYVVAPYEADAQLAYLERIGLVDGVLTEDSDLLVFGCRTVLFKLDVVNSTVVCIDRADFASVAPADGISLNGWSDSEFRAMAILSGCDYLPSIPGIGLKTACTLLRKWKTVEQVLRAVAMEGKKSIPRKYLQNFRLAEKCFLHQRAYDPLQQKLVHLSEPDADWDQESDAYVGGDLEPTVAKMLGEGDLDPVTLLPMIDINPRYVPRVLKPLPFVVNGVKDQAKDKGKGKASILNFFGPANPKVSPRAKAVSSVKPKMVVGKASGKRSLAEEMDRDIEAKRKKHQNTPPATQSRFFAARDTGASTSRVVDISRAESSLEDSKENIPLVNTDEDDDLPEADLDADLDWDSLSLVALPEREPQIIDFEEPNDGVEQEDGYISPTPSQSGDAGDLSSPRRPDATPPPRKRVKLEPNAISDQEFEVDAVSSPPEEARGHPMRLPALPLCRRRSDSPAEAILVADSPGPTGAILVADSPDPPRTGLVGPDLRDAFGDELSSEIDCFEDDAAVASGSTPTPSPSPLTPQDDVSGDLAQAFVDPEELAVQANMARNEAVAAGWRERWVLPSTKGKGRATPMLQRRETNVTPAGRHFPIQGHVRSHPYGNDTPSSGPTRHVEGGKTKRLQSRRSLTFLDSVRPKSTATKGRASDVMIRDTEDDDDAVSRAQARLAQYRCPR
ncbi:Exodeoxyribonuclease 1 [Mycena sanguinolenta]|uniref:Exodeoxyribonuclease 1 n=1 Tax=Mycena sanguinolenta TaxID=230812 RepID=A0A8H6XZU0_9AGAR|nr:Exodeoxyribonuclease 1 [Mycena sanguinolenta]